MMVQFQGYWEPERVARTLRDHAALVPDERAWANDCAQRIEDQVETYKAMREREANDE